MGLAPMFRRGDPVLLEDPVGKQLCDDFRAGGGRACNALLEPVNSVTRGELLIENPEVMRLVWVDNNEGTDRYDDPGRFSAFIGHEWSSLPSGTNVHRVVILQDGADKAGQVVPFSSVESPDPEKPWDYLQACEGNTGGEVLAFAHKGNLSNGLMFAESKLDGSPMRRQLLSDSGKSGSIRHK